jgi:hypothetical protein
MRAFSQEDAATLSTPEPALALLDGPEILVPAAEITGGSNHLTVTAASGTIQVVGVGDCLQLKF